MRLPVETRALQILVVEDEEKLSTAIVQGLTADGYEVTAVLNGEDGSRLLEKEQFDLVLLDIMLPGRSGLDLLLDLRGRKMIVPILILTSRDSIEDRVAGLDSGADDYLVKPFAFAELLARTRALLRRRNKDANDAARNLGIADLEVDLPGRKVMRSGRVLELTSREFALLEYLLAHTGTVVSREMLARDVWKETMRMTPIDNVIDVQIARLRRKIDDPFSRKVLHTVRGVGFVLREQQE